MGAWGPGSFQNDDALDWVDSLAEYDDLSFITSTLERAIDEDLVTYHHNYVETENLDNVIAAAEVVAAIKGHPGADIPEEVNEWIQMYHPVVDENIMELTRLVVARALETQELGDLWVDLSTYEAWRNVIENLQLRLQT